MSSAGPPSIPSPVFLNLACGRSYIASPEWINFDFSPSGAHVRQADLLGRLPLADNAVYLVYCSHFVEHILRRQVDAFFTECARVLKPGGVLRIVVPDFEEMCTEYLAQRHAGRQELADYMVIEILDQCVRKHPGGELGALYDRLAKGADPAIKRYIHERVGDDFPLEAKLSDSAIPGEAPRSFLGRVASRLQREYIKLVCALLPEAFRTQNVSLASVGENHAWLYDYKSLKTILGGSPGFTDVQKVAFNQSRVPQFPTAVLDAGEDGTPRKGRQSMYVEAVKLS